MHNIHRIYYYIPASPHRIRTTRVAFKGSVRSVGNERCTIRRGSCTCFFFSRPFNFFSSSSKGCYTVSHINLCAVVCHTHTHNAFTHVSCAVYRRTFVYVVLTRDWFTSLSLRIKYWKYHRTICTHAQNVDYAVELTANIYICIINCTQRYIIVNPSQMAAPWRHLAGYDRKFIARRNTCFFIFRLPRIIVVYFLMRLRCKFIQTQYQRCVYAYILYTYTICIQTATKCSKALVWKIRFSNFRCRT